VADLSLPLTDKNVAALPHAPGSQYRARDTDLPGFFVLVGSRSKGFYIQGDLRDQGRRVHSITMKICEFGDLSTRDARAKAKGLLGEIAEGRDPRPKDDRKPATKPGDVPTLSEAWERYKLVHLVRKKRSPATVACYADHFERLLVDWLELPLSVLGEEPRLVSDKHDTISRENGEAMANAAMRSFRAVYNHARKTCRRLPAENPTFGVDWNPQKRRDTGMGVRDLPAWFEQLAAIENPIRREFHLFTLLSGSRPTALKESQLPELDLMGRVLNLPRPKGGEDKAFDIPLSRAMIECLARVRRFGRVLYPDASRTWLFPSDAPCGHIVEHKEDREDDLSHWGNDLRQTYRTVAQAAGVSDLDIHLLMNHSLPGVNAGYITRSKLVQDHLRAQQEKISKLIISSVVGHGRRPSPDLSRWLNSTSRAQLSALLSADPDAVRRESSARSALRKLELQAARCEVQVLPAGLIDPPSRRLKGPRAA
jgi:hypothetical protein